MAPCYELPSALVVPAFVALPALRFTPLPVQQTLVQRLLCP